MPEYMCQYGSCHETEVPWVLSISFKGKREEAVRFCCQGHMCEWMETYAGRLKRSVPDTRTSPNY